MNLGKAIELVAAVALVGIGTYGLWAGIPYSAWVLAVGLLWVICI